MSTYLKYYALERSPFEGQAQSKVVLGTKALRDALATVQAGLAEGASRICVNGGRGMGKTSLASALPKLLSDEMRVALILHPGTEWDAHRSSLAKQWGLTAGRLSRAALLEAANSHRLVLVLDQAETVSEAFLDHLDVLLSYRTPDDRPIVQSVLFANLALVRSAQGPPSEASPLLWWLDRIQTLQLEFAPLPRDGVDTYIQKHLKRAGWRGDRLFSRDACHAIHEYSGGIPGEVGRSAEKLLVEAAARDCEEIEAALVHEVLEVDEAESADASHDEFEELVSEEEFVGADQSDEAMPLAGSPVSGEPLQRALEHFASATRDESEGSEEKSARRTRGERLDRADESTAASDSLFCDDIRSNAGRSDADHPIARDATRDGGALADFQAYLSAPPSEEELRSLREARFLTTMRLAAAIALTIGLGVLVSTWFDRPPPQTAADPARAGLVPQTVIDDLSSAPSRNEALAESRTPAPSSSPHAADAISRRAVLAQLKGPVLDPEVERTAQEIRADTAELPEGNGHSSRSEDVGGVVPAAPAAHP